MGKHIIIKVTNYYSSIITITSFINIIITIITSISISITINIILALTFITIITNIFKVNNTTTTNCFKLFINSNLPLYHNY